MGILEDLFNVRTNGNGFILSEWDDVLLQRDLERLVAEGQVKEVPRILTEESGQFDPCERKWFRDCNTGDTYEYAGPWDRGGPRFNRLSFNDLCDTTPNPRPV